MNTKLLFTDTIHRANTLAGYVAAQEQHNRTRTSHDYFDYAVIKGNGRAFEDVYLSIKSARGEYKCEALVKLAKDYNVQLPRGFRSELQTLRASYSKVCEFRCVQFVNVSNLNTLVRISY